MDIQKILLKNGGRILLKKKTKFLVLNNNQKISYIHIPSYIYIRSLSNNLEFYVKELKYTEALKILEAKIFKLVNISKPLYKKKIVLEGLGFRASFLEPSNEIAFKVGYSHKVLKKIPEGLNVKVKRQAVVVEGYNKQILGNFVDSLYKIRMPDGYKGKGIWYKYQQKKLKEVKKK